MMAGSFLSVLIVDCLDDGTEQIIDEVPFDVCRSRTPSYSAEITQYPVEKGFSISDNRRQNPDRYSIEGIVSEDSVYQSESLQGTIRTQSAHDMLLSLHRDGTLVTIIDQHRQLKDMVLTTLEFPKTRDTGNALEFRAEFENIKIVSTSAVAIPASVMKKAKRPKSATTDASKKAKQDQVQLKLYKGKTRPIEAKPQLASATTAKASKIPSGEF